LEGNARDQDLLIGRGNEELPRVVRVECIAALWIDDEDAPQRAAEHRVGDERVREATKLCDFGGRKGARRDPAACAGTASGKSEGEGERQAIRRSTRRHVSVRDVLTVRERQPKEHTAGGTRPLRW